MIGNMNYRKLTRLLALVCLLAPMNGLVHAQVTPPIDNDSRNFIQNRLRIELGDNRSATNAMLVFYSPWVNQKQSDNPILPNYVYLYLADGTAVALVDLGYDTDNRAKVEVCKLTSQQVAVSIDGKSTEFPETLGYLYVTLDWRYQGSLASTDSWIDPVASTNSDFQDVVDRRLRLKEGLGILNNVNLEPILVYATPNEEVWLYGRRFEPGISDQIRDTEAGVKLTRANGDTRIEVTKNAAASITVQIDGKDAYTFPLTKISNGVGLDVGYWMTSTTLTATTTATHAPQVPGYPLEAILLGFMLALFIIARSSHRTRKR